MLPITCPAADAAREPLVIALRGLLAHFRRDSHYDELVSILGLGFLFTAAPGRPVRQWPRFARDNALLPVAAGLGLRLRDLHPPDAAAGLEQSAEFPLHFADSYVPLIRRALEHDQPVLAWAGWETPETFNWGVICGHDGDTLLGCAAGETAPRPLVGPALQVYVAEAFTPTRMSADDALAFTARLARAAWYGDLELPAGVLSGRDAWQAWQQVAGTADAAGAHADLAELATSFTENQRAFSRWLRGLDPVTPAHREYAARWADHLDAAVAAIKPLCDVQALEAELGTAAGRKAVAQTIAERALREGAFRESLDDQEGQREG